MTSARRVATYQDVLDAPPHVVAEVLFGTLYTHARPIPHARAATVLGNVLGNRFDLERDGPGGWFHFKRPELHLGEHILVPDLAGWRRERMPQVPDAPYLTLAPNWACEVLSPSTFRIDRKEKMEIYREHQVAHVWLLDPLAKLLEVYRLTRGDWVRAAIWHGPERVRAEPFDAVELDLAVLWPA